MAFTTRDALAFLYDQEKNSLDLLTEHARLGTPLAFSLYGRNPGNDYENCMPNKFETWNPSGYGSTLPIYQAACRHEHDSTFDIIGRNIKSCIELWNRCLQLWGKPPGEDTRWPPCGDVSEQNPDTDPHRHENIYGMCQAALDPNIRDAGDFTIEDFIEGVVWPHYQWILTGLNRYHPREYLRNAYRIDSLIGCHDVFKAVGRTPDAMGALNTALKLYEFGWDNGQASYVMTHDGHLMQNWNYRDLVWSPVSESWVWPFPDGWNYLTSQSWYTGTCMTALYHLWFRCWQDPDLISYAGRLMKTAKSVGEWYDPRNMTGVNRGTLNWDGEEFFNSFVQGWTPEGIAKIGVEPMTMEAYMKLGSDVLYSGLARVLDFHEFDGGYHVLEFTDPSFKKHERVHRSRIGSAWGYEHGDPEYDPRFETRGNCFGMPTTLYASAAAKGDEYQRDLAIFAAYDYRAFYNSSDVLRSRDQSVDFIGPPANNGNFARAYHWAWLAGAEVLQGEWDNFTS